MPRLFTAIEFEPHIKERFARIQSDLKKHCMFGNFTQTENFHLTLVFLGELSAALIPSITQAMDEAVRGQTPLVLTADKFGAFNRDGKEIVWVGLSGELQHLHRLHSRLENSLVSLGLIKQKQTYSPHITLGREVVVKVPLSDIKLGALLPFTFEVREIALMESRREGGRLVYRNISSA
ncbi:MAG: RNA 2',3'-cyclic phosphodiesterase [Firmicutes bacterium]|nr:RNA 2',3'-cyclic phosphodiesterase [Bacillota bacterium]